MKLLRQWAGAAAGALEESGCWVDTFATFGSCIVVAAGKLATKGLTFVLILVGKDDTVGNSSLENDAEMAAPLTGSEPKVANISEDMPFVVDGRVAEEWEPPVETRETGPPASVAGVEEDGPVVEAFEAEKAVVDSTRI